jgi:outer membrane protein assembly factor BamB
MFINGSNHLTRREALQQSLAAALGASILGTAAAQPDAPQRAAASADWPMYHGPLGNASVPEPGVRLLDDLGRARRAWESEERDLPVGKLRSWGNPYARPSGGMAGLIASGSTVFFAYFQPRGDVEAANWTRRGVAADRLIAADDVVLAVDAATGRTRWKRVLEDRGVNHAPTKRGGWAVTPACHLGRVFSLGTTGRLYALDAATGRVLWERNIGRFHEQMEAMKRQALANLAMGRWPAMRCSPTVAQGVLVVPNYQGARDTGLIGFHPEDGRRLWELPAATWHMAAPAVWRHDGREHLLAGTYTGHLRLIDPATGRAVWEVAGLGAQEEHLAPGASHVVVNVKRGETRDKLYGGYRLTPRGAERAWAFADRPDFMASGAGDGGAYRRVSVLGNRFVIHRIYSPERGQRSTGVWLVDTASGRIVHSLTDGISAWPMVFHALGTGRLICVHDASHANPGFSLYTLEGDRLRPLSDRWLPMAANEGTSGYEVPMPYPILDGRMYLRTSIGVLRCYDVRG